MHPDEAIAQFVCDDCENEEELTLRQSIKRERSEYEIPCKVDGCRGTLEQVSVWRDE